MARLNDGGRAPGSKRYGAKGGKGYKGGVNPSLGKMQSGRKGLSLSRKFPAGMR